MNWSTCLLTRYRKNYSFKYPREQIQTTTGSLANIYSVNAISFHPVHKNIFSTAGSDGLFHFWDRDGKTRVKLFPEVGGPISATGFSYTGDLFAYAVSYDWSKGFAFNTPDGVNTIMLHRVLDNELGLGKMRKR
jgi:mRNA export factor